MTKFLPRGGDRFRRIPGPLAGASPGRLLAVTGLAVLLGSGSIGTLLAQSTGSLPPTVPALPAVAGTDLKPGFELGPGPGGGVGPAAAMPPPIAAAEQQELASVEASISLSKDRVEQLKREIDGLKGDRAQQNAALIAAGERLKSAETDVAAMEEKLGELIVEELATRGKLDGADTSISNVLAALQRISRSPPPALIVDPSDALGSARGALLISAILPQLRGKADQVIANLKRLGEIKTEALAEEQQLKANLEVLEEEQLRIATLIVARRQGETRVGSLLTTEEAQGDELAAKASSLKQLIDELTKKASAVATAAEATATANAGGPAPKLDGETIRLALANTGRTEPAVPFADARGFLATPASGENVVNFGAGDGYGGISHGLSILTRAAAEVVAPADGWVLYRGDYLNYGQIIILNAGQNYTIVLAGLSDVSVATGDFVLMGQPVGTMGSQTSGQTVATSAGVSRPTLYIEMRKNNVPVDPTGWWAEPRNPTQSG